MTESVHAAQRIPLSGGCAGSPLESAEFLASYERLFWRKVDRRSDSDCWLWTASAVNGYGQIVHRGRKARAHRYAYALLVGPIPEGLTLDHLCRNRACVNPAHLEPVTQRENVLRGLLGRKTHCDRGHEFTPENTERNGRGRKCCTCRRARQATYRAQKRAQLVDQATPA